MPVPSAELWLTGTAVCTVGAIAIGLALPPCGCRLSVRIAGRTRMSQARPRARAPARLARGRRGVPSSWLRWSPAIRPSATRDDAAFSTTRYFMTCASNGRGEAAVPGEGARIPWRARQDPRLHAGESPADWGANAAPLHLLTN